MTTTTRKDTHRPSVIIPADYSHVLEYGREWVSYDPDDGKDEEWSNMEPAMAAYAQAGTFIHGSSDDLGKAILRCDICGARFKYGSLFLHKASGEVISIGHDCADAMSLAYDVAAAKAIQGQAARIRKVVIERRQRFNQLRFWARWTADAELLAALRIDHHITKDIRARLISTGAKWGLSDRQAALVLKLAADSLLPPEKHVAVPVDDERILVEGTVVSLKLVDSDYGETWKMTVKVETPDGSWLVYGTAPDALFGALEDEFIAARKDWSADAQDENIGTDVDNYPKRRELKGTEVRFMARVSRGNRDPHFGFFSRPTKAELI